MCPLNPTVSATLFAEIMLLGLAVLLLNVCENKISATCYKIQGHGGGGGLQPWLSNVVGTDKVKGCACCLAKTEGVTECFTQVRLHTDQTDVCFVHRGGGCKWTLSPLGGTLYTGWPGGIGTTVLHDEYGDRGDGSLPKCRLPCGSAQW